MAKKAVLVEFSIWTRVVVDVPEGKEVDSDEMFEVVGGKAIEKIRKTVIEDSGYPYLDNIVEIEEDIEIPYGEAEEDSHS